MNYPFNKQAREVLRDVTGSIRMCVHKERLDQVSYQELVSVVYQGVTTRLEYDGVQSLANKVLASIKED